MLEKTAVETAEVVNLKPLRLGKDAGYFLGFARNMDPRKSDNIIHGLVGRLYDFAGQKGSALDASSQRTVEGKEKRITQVNFGLDVDGYTAKGVIDFHSAYLTGGSTLGGSIPAGVRVVMDFEDAGEAQEPLYRDFLALFKEAGFKDHRDREW